MSIEKPILFKASDAMASFFGESRPFIISPPEVSDRLLAGLKAVGIETETGRGDFGSSEGSMTCILLQNPMQYEEARGFLRKFR